MDKNRQRANTFLVKRIAVIPAAMLSEFLPVIRQEPEYRIVKISPFNHRQQELADGLIGQCNFGAVPVVFGIAGHASIQMIEIVCRPVWSMEADQMNIQKERRLCR